MVPGDPVTFQYKLFEGSDQIEIHYEAAPSDSGSHSAGIENETGTSGVQYYYGNSALTTPLAVRYGRAVDAPWLIELPATGTVEAGGSETVDIIFDASVITQTGTYTAELRFDGTFDNTVAPAVVVMHVVAEGTPAVTVEPDQTSVQAPGATVTYTVDVTNDGDVSDLYTLEVASSEGWAVTLSDDSVVLINPGETATITVVVEVPANAVDGDEDVTTVTAPPPLMVRSVTVPLSPPPLACQKLSSTSTCLL